MDSELQAEVERLNARPRAKRKATIAQCSAPELRSLLRSNSRSRPDLQQGLLT